MLRAAAVLTCLSGCVIVVAPPSSFSHATPEQAALVFGRFTAGGRPVQELRLGRFGDLQWARSALLDSRGNFAWVVEPGAYFLDAYRQDDLTRNFGHDVPPNPVWHFEVRAGEVRWQGAWEEAAWTRNYVELRTREDVQPRDVLKALSERAKGTAWESALRGELGRLSPEELPR